MQCPTCEHEAPVVEFGDPLRCPECGAYYEKAVALKARRDLGASPMAAAPPVLAPKPGSARRWIILLAIVLGVFVGYLIASPYIVVRQIQTAARAQDAERLIEYVDFPSVRQSLKDQMNIRLMKVVEQEKNNPFSAMGAAIGGAMVERMVDGFVTPSGLITLMKGNRPKIGPAGEPSTPPSAASPAGTFAGEMSYEGIDKFVVTVRGKNEEPFRFVLRRYFLSWRLTELILPPDKP